MVTSPEYTEKSKRTLFIMLAIAIIMMIIPVITNVITDVIKVEAQSSGIDATSVYETKSMDLGNNIKNLVILIPNEGHESQNIGDQSTDQRLVNQPYIPQSVTVPVGTAIMWFNDDVDHDHKITLVDQGSNLNNMIFDSDDFAYNTASQPVVMNNTGSFDYYQADVNNEDTDFVMNGTINVVGKSDNPNTTTGISTDQPNANIDTVGTLMVPTGDLPTYTSDLENGGFSILSTYNFNDIRSGGPQTLIIWGTSSSGTNSLVNVVSQLEQITPTLPYS
ncbi:MAG: cupredoxin domain-containing protein [Nitrososphaeraceae archaeon]